MTKLVLALLLAGFLACSKNDKADSTCIYTTATITNKAPTCLGWGIDVQGVVYPSRNIPDSFKQNGLKVCTDYELFNDMALCACCGGQYANILSMSN